jgi:hypothetical protein
LLVNSVFYVNSVHKISKNQPFRIHYFLFVQLELGQWLLHKHIVKVIPVFVIS